MLHIVLWQPEIPHNTGAIGRLCLATGARLHLIQPLGFSLEEKHLRRAGLDYWEKVDVRLWECWEHLRASASREATFFFIECGGMQTYWEADFATPAEVWLVFGPETRSLPPSLLAEQACLSIPMKPEGTRSLNLATAAAIVLYEAVRQRSA
jgi:tRNA (cytidine/uridine-2'-O-)-methyltransferase